MSGVRRIKYAINCDKHGEKSKQWAGNAVFVPGPADTKKKRINHGCPECKKETKP